MKKFFNLSLACLIAISFFGLVSCEKEQITNVEDNKAVVAQKDYTQDATFKQLVQVTQQLAEEAKSYVDTKLGENQQVFKDELAKAQTNEEKKQVLQNYFPDQMPYDLTKQYNDLMGKFKKESPDFFKLPIEQRKEMVGSVLAKNSSNKTELVDFLCIIEETIAWGWSFTLYSDGSWSYTEWFYYSLSIACWFWE